MSGALATAKLNLALVVGPLRDDGRHEVVTVLQRIELADRISLEPADELRIEGFAEAAGTTPRWAARIRKQIPVAAGLGGGSSDAATALRLANETLPEPLPAERLHDLAAELGADVPFFLTVGPQLGTGTGTELEPVELSQDYAVVLLLPQDEQKPSTGSVYADFDRRGGADGFDERRASLHAALAEGDLAALPPNDLAASPHAQRLLELGAFRADASGAGPAVFGLFAERERAVAAEAELRALGRTWITVPTWYG
jgi:4-diphosphocytidyl-2-C-methyl-D-erythritol kinase